jgi:hypothetical protein
MRNKRKFKFAGSHPKLVTGNFYTLREISDISGVNNKTIHSRMYGRDLITDRTITAREYNGRWKKSDTHLSNDTERLSAKWLSAPITKLKN